MGGLLVLYRHEEILPKSSLRPPKKKLAMVLSKIQVNDPGPSWPTCSFVFYYLNG